MIESTELDQRTVFGVAAAVERRTKMESSAANLTLGEYLKVLRENWAIVLLCVLLATSLAVLYCFLATPQYLARTTLYVAVQTTDAPTTSDLSLGGSYAQQAVLSYVDVITSSIVLDLVSEDLGIEDQAGLARSITAHSPAGTVLIDVEVTRPDHVEATEIARSVAVNFAEVVEEVLEAPHGGGTGPVKVTTVQEARPVETPVSPNWTQSILLGLLLGLILGVAVSVLRFATNTRLRTAADVERVTDIPVLGAIATDPSHDDHPLAVHTMSQSLRAESFRSLRTNLQFVNVSENRSFVITSSGPQEGKSSICCNVAVSLANTGASVALVDADLRRPKIAEYMGIDGAVGLSSVLAGLAELEDAVRTWNGSKLDVLTAGRIPPNPSELLSSSQMTEVHRLLSSRYDWVLIDSPPVGVVTDAAVLSGMVGGTIIVVNVRRGRKPGLLGTISALEGIANHISGIVLTGVAPRTGDAYGVYSVGVGAEG
ncbi:MAG TPA: polysaccharide biosynthesis tyrosine autokinase [Actinomycetaceae bacterium]|nr:polysaccharide biosynthesis tyrosine autokinase [Actinomycetaceae bacterium]